jgi:hypothetical protein
LEALGDSCIFSALLLFGALDLPQHPAGTSSHATLVARGFCYPTRSREMLLHNYLYNDLSWFVMSRNHTIPASTTASPASCTQKVMCKANSHSEVARHCSFRCPKALDDVQHKNISMSRVLDDRGLHRQQEHLPVRLYCLCTTQVAATSTTAAKGKRHSQQVLRVQPKHVFSWVVGT